MHRDASGLLHLNAVVFGAWSAALGHDMAWLHARLPALVTRTTTRIERPDAWYLRLDCHLPARPGKREAVQVSVASKSGAIWHPALDRELLEGADGVVFVVDTALVNDEPVAQHAILQTVSPPAIVYQFDDACYPSTPVRTASELRAFFGTGERRVFETKASHGEGVVETFVGLIEEMMIRCVV